MTLESSTSLTLAARVPFSLPAVVKSHGWIRLLPFAEGAQAGGPQKRSGFTRVEQLSSGCVVDLRVGEVPGGVSVAVTGSLNGSERQEVSCKVTWMLGLDQDFTDFYARVRQEPKLAHVEERAQGRLLRSPTLFEDVVKTILTTNTAWGGTVRMVRGLVTHFGPSLPDDASRHAFPAPERLAELDEGALRAQAGLGYRAPYVLALSRAVASGDLDLEALRSTGLPTDQLRQRLLAIKGVGDYAAAHLLILLGRYDFVPVDSWARSVVSRTWYDGEPVGRAEVEAAFEKWGRWRGLAYWFWDWSSLDEG